MKLPYNENRPKRESMHARLIIHNKTPKIKDRKKEIQVITK